MKDAFDEISRIVEKACKSEKNIFGYGIWTHHILPVVRIARRLAPQFDADIKIVELAALLHDYASVKDEALYENHHIHGPIEAEKLLRRYNYYREDIDEVKHAIEAHRGSVDIEGKSPEAMCLRNADALAHIENVTSLLNLAYVQHKMGIDEGANWVSAKLQRSWRKLSPEVKERTREEYEGAMVFLSNNSG